MGSQRQDAFTLIELLIVVAIIGILGAVLLPNLMNARTTAFERSADAYVHSVYKAAFAHLSDDVSNSLITGSCLTGYTAGSYSVPSPGPNVLTSCTVGGTLTSPTVSATTAPRGRTITMP